MCLCSMINQLLHKMALANEELRGNKYRHRGKQAK